MHTHVRFLSREGRDDRRDSAELPRVRISPGDQGLRCHRWRHSGEPLCASSALCLANGTWYATRFCATVQSGIRAGLDQASVATSPHRIYVERRSFNISLFSGNNHVINAAVAAARAGPGTCLADQIRGLPLTQHVSLLRCLPLAKSFALR